MSHRLFNNFLFFLIFLFFTLFIRYHTASNEVITWDEATYIIAGREVLMGFLPYESLYEMKPPLLYYFYSIPLFFSQSLEAIRIYGILNIAISSFLIFFILKDYTKQYHSFLAALSFASIMNYYFWLETSSEIVSLPFILLSYIFFKKHEKSNLNLFLTGIFISISTLIRLNIAYLVIFMVVFLIIKKVNIKQKIKEISLFGISGLIPLIFLIIIYYKQDLISLLYAGMIEVSLAYSSENSFLIGIYKYIKTIYKLCYFNPFPFLILMLLFISLIFKKSLLKKDNKYLILFTSGILFSILATGQGFSHHLIMIIPFMVIFIFSKLINSKLLIFIRNIIISIIIIIPLYSSIMPNIILLRNNFDVRKNHQLRELSNLIGDSSTKILALDYHLLYFYSNNPYPLKLIHTPALARKTTKKRLIPLQNIGYYSNDYINKAFSNDYDYILCSTRICIEGRPNIENKKIKNLLKNYEIIKTINNFSRWEHTKIGNLLLYKKIKKSD